MNISFLFRLAAIVGLLAFSTLAQEFRATLLGRVTDPTGAVLAGVAVEAQNTATGVVTTAQTSDQGIYRIPFLLAGPYEVTFALNGFNTLVRDKVELRIADQVTLDVGLTVGSISEQITVEGSTPLLEVASASLGQVVDRKRLEELPFREGNPHELVKLAPGVSTHTHLRLNKPGMTGGLSEISVDGSNARRSDFALDGIANTAGDRLAYSPPAAAVQEVKVQTSNYDASIGYTAGGVVNLVTRNGTNDFHAEAWYFYRNSRFDSRDFFQTINNQPKPKYTDKRGGFAAGGPIRRDKAHFFAAAEFNPYENPYSWSMTIPTAQMRNGDLTELNRFGQIYDPLSGRPDPASPTRVLRDPIAGNIIPASRLNATSAKLIRLWPDPNVPGIANNFQHPNSVETHNWKTVTSRVDYNFSAVNRLFVRYSEAAWSYEDPDFHLNRLSSGNTTDRTLRLIAIDDTHTFSPSLVMNLRFGMTYQKDIFDLFSSGKIKLSDYGLDALSRLSSTPDRQVLPLVQIDGYTAYRQQWSAGASQTNRDTMYSGVAAFNHMKGSHSLAFGFEHRRYEEFRLDDARARSPQINFGSNWTVGPYNTSAGVNQLHALATFLLGTPSSGNMMVVPSRAELAPRSALYLQDDWRVNRRLTLNLGLRYELENPTVEANDASVNGIDLATPLPIEDAVRRAYAQAPIPQVAPNDFRVRGGILYANVGGRRRGLWEARKSNFMPRIGAAFQIDNKTVLRAGYGLFYDALGTIRSDVNQTGYSRSTSMQTTLDSIVPRPGAFANPFPDGLLQPLGNSLGLMTDVGNAIGAPYPEGVRTPYGQRISFGFQRQLPLSFVVDATYAANRSGNLAVTREYNAVPIQYFSTSPVRDQAAIDFQGANFPNPFRGLIPTNTSLGGSANTSRGQLLRPYPQFTQIRMNDTIGKSWYDSLQMRVERRFSQGVTLNLSYTWSKMFEQNTYREFYELQPGKRLSVSDRTHALQVNGVVEVPAGRGRLLGRNWNRALDAVLGGWQFSSMYRSESGFPLSLGNVLLKPGATFKDLPIGNPTWDRAFNIDIFERAGAVQLGNNIRYHSSRVGDVRNDGFDMFDISLQKTFAVKERFQFVLRAESYNALDSINLRSLSNGPTAANFGQYTAVNGYARQYQFSLKARF